jgi:hypothetical protein
MVNAFIASVSAMIAGGSSERESTQRRDFTGGAVTSMVGALLEDAVDGLDGLLVLLLIQQFLQCANKAERQQRARCANFFK